MSKFVAAIIVISRPQSVQAFRGYTNGKGKYGLYYKIAKQSLSLLRSLKYSFPSFQNSYQDARSKQDKKFEKFSSVKSCQIIYSFIT